MSYGSPHLQEVGTENKNPIFVEGERFLVLLLSVTTVFLSECALGNRNRSFNLEPLLSLVSCPQAHKCPAPCRGQVGLETPTNCPQIAGWAPRNLLGWRASARPLLQDNPF